MKVSGFTFARNAIKLQYPIVESINSILPIVDEFVVNVGDSEDDTLGLVRSIGSPKIRIVESKWNPNVLTGGYVLAQQTNIALLNCTGEWAIYLQADEAIHEAEHERLVRLMDQYRTDKGVDGLLLQRITFYGDYNTIVTAHPFMYDLACRVVKPHHFVLSRGDAAGFCAYPKYKERGRKLRAVDTGLTVFHYGDVRPPDVSTDFLKEKARLWSDDNAATTNYYTRTPRQFVGAYTGSHPASMRDRIAAVAPQIDLQSRSWRTRLSLPEWRRRLRSRFIKMAGRREIFPWTTGSYKIVARYRDGFIE